MLDAGAVLQNRYLIISKIGQGGMGAVYQAKDQRLGVKVALKETIVSGDSLEKAFEREARLLAKLRHPVLPVVSDYFSENNGQYLVMQYIEGKDLGQLLSERGTFSLVEVLAWADRLLDALDYLHTQNPSIIHRDIKPNNLKLTDRGEIILLDFGLAKGSTTVVQNSSHSNISVYGYTPHYAPIEQVEGTGTDARSDLYALAATLYHLLTRVKIPDAMPRVLSVINGQGDPLRPIHEINPKVPLPISQVLSSALSQKRDERPNSAIAMKTALEEAIKTTNDPNILSLLNPTHRLNNSIKTSEYSPLGTNKLEPSSELSTLVKTEKAIDSANSVNKDKQSALSTDPQGTAQETQLATQANETLAKTIPIKEKFSKMPFILAIGSIFVLAFVLVIGLFFLPKTNQVAQVIAVNAFDASKEQNNPTPLSAKEILSKGLNEPRYFEFIAQAGEIKLNLNVVSNGASVLVEIFDKDKKTIRYKNGSDILSVASSNNGNEQVEGVFLNPTKQKIVLKLSNTYPDNLVAFRLRLDGVLGLTPTNKKEDRSLLEALEEEFRDRDNPTPLASNEIIRFGSEKHLYYSFVAEPGLIKLTLDVISSDATVGVVLFDSDSKMVRFSNSSTNFSLKATSYKHEKNTVNFQNPSKQTFLLRIYNLYPKDLKAYRLSLKGPIKFSKNTKKDESLSFLLAEFKSRDNPITLGNNEIINRGNEKDLYYTFRMQPGDLYLTLDLIASGSNISVQFFDDKDELIKTNDNSLDIFVSSNNHHEKKSFILNNDRNQSILMRVSNAYPESIKAYRIKLEGEIQIINPTPDSNKAFESLAKLFEPRDNPKELESNEITGIGNERDSYYIFPVVEGELKLKVNLLGSGGTLNIELFDEESNPILFENKKQILSITSSENKVLQQSSNVRIGKDQSVLMRVSNAYPESIKEYKILLSGDIELPIKDEEEP